MENISLSAKSYLDFAGLGDLKARAKDNQEEAAQEVGRQFEAMFVQMVFKVILWARLRLILLSRCTMKNYLRLCRKKVSLAWVTGWPIR